MGLFDFFRRRQSIRDASELADFIDRHAAFLVQKGIYEYSRARAGHYAKVLFAEPEFHDAVEQSRWRAYPLGLAMVAEVVEGVLRPYGSDRHRQLDALADSFSRSSTATRSRPRSANRPGARRVPSWRAASSSSACIRPSAPWTSASRGRKPIST